MAATTYDPPPRGDDAPAAHGPGGPPDVSAGGPVLGNSSVCVQDPTTLQWLVHTVTEFFNATVAWLQGLVCGRSLRDTAAPTGASAADGGDAGAPGVSAGAPNDELADMDPRAKRFFEERGIPLQREAILAWERKETKRERAGRDAGLWAAQIHWMKLQGCNLDEEF